MANQIVAGEQYYELDGQLLEIKRQLRQSSGYPFNPYQLKLHLQDAIEGKFGPGEIYGVRLGGPETTDDIVQQLRGAGLFVSDHITQANFPLKPHAIEDIEVEIIDPGCPFSEEEGLQFLKAAYLERPTEEHALRFAEQRGRTTTGKKRYIIFLHKHWQVPRGGRKVLCVDRLPIARMLTLYCPDGTFGDDCDNCVLAGVRLRKHLSAASTS